MGWDLEQVVKIEREEGNLENAEEQREFRNRNLSVWTEHGEERSPQGVEQRRYR